MFGFFITLIPIPVIKNFLSDFVIISCKIPLIFFLLINKSFGFLKLILFFIYLESVCLTKLQFNFVTLSIENLFSSNG